MLKRIFWVGLLTGSGQLFSIFALKWVTRNATPFEVKGLAQTDSLILFMINAIAMGLQSAAMRDLATHPDWKADYRDNQSARMALSLTIALLAALFFVNPYYLLFLAAPLLAMNGDYALYARGQATTGSAVAFVRLLIPSASILVTGWVNPAGVPAAYIVSTLAIYVVTNLYIAHHLGTDKWVRPRFDRLRLYIRSLPLGIVVLALYFIGMGLMLVIPYFYSSAITAVAFAGLKFYVLFKGVLRIIQQAFIREMTSYDVCFKVDQLASLAGLTFAVFAICFPQSFINLFFGSRYLPYQLFFITLAVAGLVYSLFSSFIIKAMLENKDKPYAIVAAGSAVLTMVAVIVGSAFRSTAESIGFSMLFGETIFAFGMIYILGHRKLLSERLLFFAGNLPFVLLPLAGRYFLGDGAPAFFGSGLLFLLAIAFVHLRKFSFPAGADLTGPTVEN